MIIREIMKHTNDGLGNGFYQRRFCRRCIRPGSNSGAKVLVAVFLTSTIAYFSYFSALNSYNDLSYQHAYSANGISHHKWTTCGYPVLDPFDPSIRDYIKQGLTLSCENTQPLLTFVDDENSLRINLTTWNATEPRPLCFYRTYSLGVNESTLVYDAEVALLPDKPAKIRKDFVSAYCRNDGLYTPFYQEDHVLVAPLTTGPKNLIENENEDYLSVIFIFIDSTSLSAAKRYLPKTFDYLTKRLGAFVLNGYNKVGDNSFANMLPILTGKRTVFAGDDMPIDIPGDLTQMYVDDWPLIWKEFSSRGYVTAFNEDELVHSLFVNPTKGLLRQPTDHYFKPFWLRVYGGNKLKAELRAGSICYGNWPIHELQTDTIRRFLTVYKGKRKFGYNFFTALSHEYDFELQYGDETFLKLLRSMHENGSLNKTVLLFGSDHGHRFSHIRETLVGALEERMPFMSFTFPQWFHRKFPKLARQLKENSDKLTSNFDIHETLLDIAKGNFGGEQRPAGSRGLSLLYPIPANRTCKQAGIPEHYCVCSNAQSIDINDPMVKQGALALVGLINNELRDSLNVCSTLVLQSIARAELITHNTKVVAYPMIQFAFSVFNSDYVNSLFLRDSATVWLRLAVKTVPGDGLFEATLQYDGNSRTYQVATGDNKDGQDEGAEISRINAYGNQSSCLPASDVKRRKYCFCSGNIRTVLQAESPV